MYSSLMSTPKKCRTDGGGEIQYKIITNGEEIPRSDCFRHLDQILSTYEKGGKYYGVYFGDALTDIVRDGIVLKPYRIWVKVNERDVIEEPCSPYWRIKTLMEKKCMQMTECVITVCDRIIESDNLNIIDDMGISEIHPLWIRQRLHIPFWVSVGGFIGYEMMHYMKPNEKIDSYVKTNFGKQASAFVHESVLTPDETCRSARIYGYPGFTIKSRMVRIKKQHGYEDKEDLSGCHNIEDVLNKLSGESLYHNNRLLPREKLLDTVIMSGSFWHPP